MTRADRLAAVVAKRELDALLVTDPVDVRYLTGFTGTNALVVVAAARDEYGERRVFVTDFRYVGRAAAEVGEEFERVTGERDLLGDVAGALPDGARTLGFDDGKTTVRTHARLAELLGDRAELVAAGGVVGELRAIKEAPELDAIRAAAGVADDALTTVLERGLVGRTEREVAIDLEQEIRLRGSEPSFPPIVAAGVHADQPHAEPGDALIPRDVLVTIDWGATVDGYCSDCTRTYATGSVDAGALAIYEVVRQAQAVALESVRAGVLGRDADAAARSLIEAAGHGDHFGHGLGHGVGLEVHEEPRLSKAGDTPLAPGMVVTVEPGVYVPGHHGVRIEDLVVVREDGAEILSSLPKALTQAG